MSFINFTMWFGLGRSEGYPTQYAPNPTPVTVDVLEAGFITAFLILAVCFLISLPSTKYKSNLISLLRIVISLTIGLLLLLSNFGQEWEVGHVKSRMPYKSGSSAEIEAKIGVKIGLRSVNVTLKAENTSQLSKKEVVDYNERFEWTWDQGRFGFGPYAGVLQQEFRAAQYRGVPTPILWVVDYFVIDGEGFRHGRFYRTAGWYSHIALWTAFACWLVANILFLSVVHYGAYFLGISGILQLVANLVWLVVRNPNDLVIPFEDDTIHTKFGPSYWLNFINGLTCLGLSVVILLLEHLCHDHLHSFFGIDPLDSYDKLVYLSRTENVKLRQKEKRHNIEHDPVPLVTLTPPNSNIQELQEEEETHYDPVYVKRATIFKPAPAVVRSNKPQHLMQKYS